MRLSLQEREYAGSFSPVCGNSNVALPGKRQRIARHNTNQPMTMSDPLAWALRRPTQHEVCEEDIHVQSFFLPLGNKRIFDACDDRGWVCRGTG
jgi:hypothetical protein